MKGLGACFLPLGGPPEGKLGDRFANLAPTMPPASRKVPNPVETEAKIRVRSFGAIRRRIESAGGRMLSARMRETNTLFDRAGALAAGGRSFRVRRYGDKGSVTLKGRAEVQGGLKSRVELETEVASPEILADILISLGFAPQFRYEKFREVWRLRGTAVCLDETPIGRFLEIEGRAAAVHKVALELGFSAREFLSASYPALWLAAGRGGDMTFPARAGQRSRKARA